MIYQQPLPAPYPTLTDDELKQRILEAKRALGDRVVILTHHYQRPEIVQIGDMRGDSLKLAQYAAAQEKAEYIVYCGVHFMAESADILKRGKQIVVLPDMGAGCDMAAIRSRCGTRPGSSMRPSVNSRPTPPHRPVAPTCSRPAGAG